MDRGAGLGGGVWCGAWDMCGAQRQGGTWEGVPGVGVNPRLALDSHVAFRSPLASASLGVLICRMGTTSLPVLATGWHR